MSRSACFVVNPRAAGGRTGGRLAELRGLAGSRFERWDVRVSEGPEHATDLAREAALEGFDLVVAVGGDGTANEVVNGLVQEGRSVRPGVGMGLLPAGTGSDLARALALPADWSSGVARLGSVPLRPVDVVDVRFVRHDGQPGRRICLNVLGFGMAGEVVARVNRGSKRFGGAVAYVASTATALLAYTAPRVRVRWDVGGNEQEHELMLVNGWLANGQYCGGGMWVGKGASFDDGQGAITLIPDEGLVRATLRAPHLFSGRLRELDGIVAGSSGRLVAEALDGSRVLIDIDGEQPGILPMEATVISGELSVAA